MGGVGTLRIWMVDGRTEGDEPVKWYLVWIQKKKRLYDTPMKCKKRPRLEEGGSKVHQRVKHGYFLCPLERKLQTSTLEFLRLRLCLKLWKPLCTSVTASSFPCNPLTSSLPSSWLMNKKLSTIMAAPTQYSALAY